MSADLRFNCHHCGQKLVCDATEFLSGQELNCPACDNMIHIPHKHSPERIRVATPPRKQPYPVFTVKRSCGGTAVQVLGLVVAIGGVPAGLMLPIAGLLVIGVGVAVVIQGGKMQRGWTCSNCGADLAGRAVKHCAACSSDLGSVGGRG